MNTNSKPSSKFNKKLATILIVSTVIVAIVAAQQIIPYLQNQPSNQPNSNINLPEINLTVVGANGEELVLHSNDIVSLQTHTAAGGYKRGNGSILGVGNYTGVPILNILNLVGGISNNNIIQVTAADSYTATYTYNQVNGQELNTYDPQTGDTTQATQPLTMIVAYHLKGKTLPDSDGPLTIAIVGPQGLLTDGKLWTRLLVKIEILNAT